MNYVPDPDRRLLPFANVIHDLDTRRKFFRQLPLFADLEANLCDAIADTAVHYQRPPKSMLIRQNEIARETSIVIRGLVQVSREADGIVYYMPYRGPGMPIGMNNLFSNDIVRYTMQTVMPTDFFALNSNACKEAFDKSKVLGRNIIRTAIAHMTVISDTFQQVIRLSHKDGRVIGELLEIADALATQYVSYGSQATDTLQIGWLKREFFAEKVGCSIDGIAKALQLLKAENLIEVNKTGHIAITPDQLEQLRLVYDLLHDQAWPGVFRVTPPRRHDKPDKTLRAAIAYMVARDWEPE